jgi:hypothetical protein
MSSLKRRADGIKKFTPAADYTGKEGYGVDLAAGVATISTSASAPIKGVILEGGTVAEGITVAILGAFNGAVDVKLSGTVAADAEIQQAADGTFVTDAGSGSRVIAGVADQGGVSGDLVSAFLRTPVARS